MENSEKQIKEKLKEYIDLSDDIISLNKIKKALSRFSKLDKDLQRKAISEILSSTDNIIFEEEKKQGKRICENNGHQFGEWKEKKYTTEDFDEAGWCFVKEEVRYYIRICERCGLMENQHIMPEEFKKKNK